MGGDYNATKYSQAAKVKIILVIYPCTVLIFTLLFVASLYQITVLFYFFTYTELLCHPVEDTEGTI